MMKYFPRGGNEIKYVEKPRKLHHFSPFCGNKLILQLPVLYSLLFGSNRITYYYLLRILIIYLFTGNHYHLFVQS